MDAPQLPGIAAPAGPGPDRRPEPGSAGYLVERVRRHYADPAKTYPGAIVLTEVTNPIAGRRIDVLSIGLTSRATLQGHEIKARRADWLNELDDPTKADAWVPYVHGWWVVAPSTAIVHPEELPPGWGLMIPGRGRRRVEIIRPAEQRPDHAVSLPWLLVKEITKKIDTLRAEAVERARAEAQRATEQRVRAHHDTLLNHLATVSPAAARLGNDLADVLGQPVERLQHRLHPNAVTRELLRLAWRAATAPTNQLPLQELVSAVERLRLPAVTQLSIADQMNSLLLRAMPDSDAPEPHRKRE